MRVTSQNRPEISTHDAPTPATFDDFFVAGSVISELEFAMDVPGASQPWKVVDLADVDDDGSPRPYIVKHFRAMEEPVRLTEYICGSVAAQIDPTIPRPVLVEFTEGFLEELRTLPKAPRGLDGAVAGPQVGYAWLSGMAPFVIQPNLSDRLARASQIGDIVGADYLLQNYDRHPGNILVELRSRRGKPAHVLHAIDWDAAMDGARVSMASLAENQHKNTLLKCSNSLYQLIRSTQDFKHYIAALAGWKPIAARARMIVNGVPKSWGYSEPELEAIVSYLLARAAAATTRLARLDDPEGAFKNFQPSMELTS